MQILVRRLLYTVLSFVGVFLLAIFVIRFLITRPISCTPLCVGLNLADRDLSGVNLQGTNFVEANLQGADLNLANLREADLSGANLVNANLRNADLSDAKLIGANLTNANLGGSILIGADLSGANLSAADLTSVDLTETLLSGASFTGAKLTDVRLTEANLTGIEFTGATLAGVDLQGANLSGASLSQADLSGALLTEADLTGSWLNLANLTGADMSGADLAGSSLIGSQLPSANLQRSHLRGATLVGANLDGANLRGADLTQVRVAPAQLIEEDLRLDPVLAELNQLQRSTVLQLANLSGVQFDRQTQWPPDLRPRAAVASADDGAPLSADTPGPEDTAATPAGEQPAEPSEPEVLTSEEAQRVKVNFFINAIRAVDSKRGAYEMDFYLDFYWFDPNLNGQDPATVDPSTLWNPNLDVINSRNVRTLFEVYSSSLEPGTNVRLSLRLIGTFSTPFDLHDFPFDQQRFSFQLESAEFDSETILFDFIGLLQPVAHSQKPYIQRIPKGRFIGADAVQNEWKVDEASIVQFLHVLPYDNSSWSQFRVDVLMTRRAAPYFWKVVLVLALIMLLVCSALLINGQQMHFRLWMLLVLFLITVMYNLIMWRTLPSVGYLTFLDRYLLICYSVVIAAAVVAIGTKFLYEWCSFAFALRIDRSLAVLYPVLLVGLHVLLFWRAM